MNEQKELFLGCDFGSSAIKVVLLDNDNNLAGSHYEPNTGILESTFRALDSFRSFEIKALGITGSGRHFGEALLGADSLVTEIIAQAKAAVSLHPEVSTILEIGGEDSKIIFIENGRVCDFAMNTLCGGGTGSMLENIAHRLGIDIRDYGELALQSRNPVSLSGKCGVFAQSSLVSKLNQGFDKSDIAMGAARAVVNNFFSILVRNRKIRKEILFQGATALNKALKTAFQEKLQADVIIPQHPHLMGAIGAAMLAREHVPGRTVFKGWTKLSPDKVALKHSNLSGCANSCEIVEIVNGTDGSVSRFGQRCGKCGAD
ncbi:MAG: acyl-CoA dehydratase activase [Candidatus Wallbacteria bacterium]|nr:acyl-CoA dehydratase activase [Candidatus Wallbacteria bacterium]